MAKDREFTPKRIKMLDLFGIETLGLNALSHNESLAVTGGHEGIAYRIGVRIGATLREITDATGKAVSMVNDILFGELFKTK